MGSITINNVVLGIFEAGKGTAEVVGKCREQFSGTVAAYTKMDSVILESKKKWCGERLGTTQAPKGCAQSVKIKCQ